MELDINKIKQEVLENVNSTELADDIIHGLQYGGSLEIPGFVYRKDDPGLGGLFVDVKHRGVPNSLAELSEDEQDELQWAWEARVEAFIKQLNQKYGEILVYGRSGGYWGLPLDNNISDLIKVNITDEKLNEVIEKSIAFSKDWAKQNGYELDDDEYEMAEYVLDNIKDDLYEYVTLEPTEKLLNFKKDIEDEAARWEGMDFTQFVSLI